MHDQLPQPDKQIATSGSSFAPVSVLVAAGVGLLFVTPAAAEPRAVIELFTSQGCSSCPEADKLLGEIAKDPSVIAVSLPIDYWDYLGWKDTLADPKFTARQKAYSKVRGDRQVYTPQVVVNGKVHALGSDRASIEKAIKDSTGKTGVMSVPVKMSVAQGQITVSLPESVFGQRHGRGLDLFDREADSGCDRPRRKSRQGHHLSQRGAQLAEGRRLERQAGDVDGADRKSEQRGCRRRDRLCAGRQSRQARRDARRGVLGFAVSCLL